MTGDQVIKHLSDMIRLHTRETDIAGRYGGEEFAILLPDTSIDNAYIFAERLRKAVDDVCVKHNEIEVNYTISMGIAEVGPSIKTYEAWIEHADAALYQSKNEGRNRVTLYNV